MESLYQLVESMSLAEYTVESIVAQKVYICMYVCMYVFNVCNVMYVCMYVCMDVCM